VSTEIPDDYYRRDRSEGLTPPDLGKTCSYAEHIVRARGRRTQFTSVSLDPKKIRDFGDSLYKAKRPDLEADQHAILGHHHLIQSLQATVQAESKADRARAIQALRYARSRAEGLILWRFNTSGIEAKNLVNWAFDKIQKYFAKV
jgi:hypothetical protein